MIKFKQVIYMNKQNLTRSNRIIDNATDGYVYSVNTTTGSDFDSLLRNHSCAQERAPVINCGEQAKNSLEYICYENVLYLGGVDRSEMKS